VPCDRIGRSGAVEASSELDPLALVRSFQVPVTAFRRRPTGADHLG